MVAAAKPLSTCLWMPQSTPSATFMCCIQVRSPCSFRGRDVNSPRLEKTPSIFRGVLKPPQKLLSPNPDQAPPTLSIAFPEEAPSSSLPGPWDTRGVTVGEVLKWFLAVWPWAGLRVAGPPSLCFPPGLDPSLPSPCHLALTPRFRLDTISWVAESGSAPSCVSVMSELRDRDACPVQHDSLSLAGPARQALASATL